MQNKDENQTKGTKPNMLGNDEILEFAEEVLGSSGSEEPINLDDAQEHTNEGSEEIIDLTEVADTPPNDDADILDLTEIVAEPEDTEDEIIDLDEIAIPSADEQEEEIMELEEMIDNADDQDDEIVDLEEMAIEPTDDDEFLDIEDIDTSDITPDNIIPESEEQDDGVAFIDEEELSLDVEDLGTIDDEALDEQLTLDTNQFEGTFELDDTIEAALKDSVPHGDPAPPEPAGTPDLPVEQLELSENEQKALEEDLSMAFDEEDIEDIFESTAESAETLDDMDSIGIEAETLDVDIDLMDIANELTTAQDTAPDTADQMTADFQEPSEIDPVPTEDELLPPEDLTIETEEMLPSDTDADVEFFETEELPDDRATGDAVDLSGFEAGHLATAISSETPEHATGLDSSFSEQSADEDPAFTSQPEVEEVFEVPSEPVSPNDLAEVADTAEISQPDFAPDDLSGLEPEAPGPPEDTFDTLFAETPAEPEKASEIEIFTETDQITPYEETAAGTETITESLTAADMPAYADDSESQELGGLTPDAPLELELDSEGEPEKSIHVYHETSPPKDFPPIEEPEDLSIEGISAAEDMSALEQTSGFVSAEISGTEELENGQAPDELAVRFEKTDSGKGLEIHSTADPISIKVKEHGVEDHANADDLLKVFDKPPESDSLEDLEPAIERVVQKVLSEKIEGLLIDAIESAVTREIDRLKGILRSDLKIDDDS